MVILYANDLPAGHYNPIYDQPGARLPSLEGLLVEPTGPVALGPFEPRRAVVSPLAAFAHPFLRGGPGQGESLERGQEPQGEA